MRGENERKYTIKNLAESLNVSDRTIKEWEKKGYIPKAKRNKWDWRVYSEQEILSIVTTVKQHGYFRNKQDTSPVRKF